MFSEISFILLAIGVYGKAGRAKGALVCLFSNKVFGFSKDISWNPEISDVIGIKLVFDFGNCFLRLMIFDFCDFLLYIFDFDL